MLLEKLKKIHSANICESKTTLKTAPNGIIVHLEE